METGTRREDAVGEWGYPPHRPFILLGVYFLVGTLQLLLTVWHPPLADTRVGIITALAAVSAAQALLTLVAGFALATWALPYLVGSGIVVASVSAAASAGGQGQLVTSFYLAVLGVYAGYFLSVRAVRILLVLAVITFGAAISADFKLDSPSYVVGIVFLVVGVTLVVSNLVQRLRVEAVRDPLTGALNRRGLLHAAQVLHGLDERRHEPTTVVEIDLNGFKAFNDMHGHQAGDDLLAAAVRDWSGVLRRSDVLSRTGGDEFVLLLPATSVVEAEALLDRMREANPVEWSAGVTAWAHGDSLPATLGHADEAMYLEKSRRRAQSWASRDQDLGPGPGSLSGH